MFCAFLKDAREKKDARPLISFPSAVKLFHLFLTMLIPIRELLCHSEEILTSGSCSI